MSNAKRNSAPEATAARRASPRRKQFGVRKQLQFLQCLAESDRELRKELGAIMNPEPYSYSV